MNFAIILPLSLSVLISGVPSFGQESAGPYEVTEIKGGQSICAGEDLSQGFGFSLAAGNDAFLVGSYHVWDPSIPEPKAWRMIGHSDVYDARSLALRIGGLLENRNSKCDEGKGFGYTGTFVSDLNRDGMQDLAIGVPNTGSPETQILQSTADGFELKQILFSELKGPFSSIKKTDWFGRSVQFIADQDAGTLVVSAPSFQGGRAYGFSLASGELIFKTEPSSSKINDRNGYDSELTPDLDGDGRDDFALLPSFQGDDRASMDVPGELHIYSSKDGARLLTIASQEAACRAVTAAKFVDDLDQDGERELVLGFAYCDAQDGAGSSVRYAGRILVIKGEEIVQSIKERRGTKLFLSELSILSESRGVDQFALLGGDIEDWIDLNHDGIREFFVSEMGFSPTMRVRNAGRAMVLDGKTQKPMPQYEIVGGGAYEFFPTRIATIPGLKTFAMSSPHADQGKGVVRFYRFKSKN